MHRVQTSKRRVAPFTSALIVCRFGRKTRLVRLLAWLTLLPTARVFPQISHALATVGLPDDCYNGLVNQRPNELTQRRPERRQTIFVKTGISNLVAQTLY